MATHVLTILAVEDVAAARRFYAEAFGWPQVVDVPVYAEFLVAPGMRLGLYRRDAFGRTAGALPAPQRAGAVTGTEIYLHVDRPSDAVDRLRAAGARELSPLAPRPWGDDAAYFADPDGNVLVVARPTAPGESADPPAGA